MIIKLKWETIWVNPDFQHRSVYIFVGPDKEHLVNSGRLIFTLEEAPIFRSTIRQGILGAGFSWVLEEGWEEHE